MSGNMLGPEEWSVNRARSAAWKGETDPDWLPRARWTKGVWAGVTAALLISTVLVVGSAYACLQLIGAVS